jgi:uncharacterized protein YndB with AHSA1/START domain
MLNFEKTITINKPPHKVFEFVADRSNVPLWRYDVIETKHPPRAIKVGDSLVEFIGSKGIIICEVEVVELVPDRKLMLKVTGGTMNLPTRELIFDDLGGRTKLTVKISEGSNGLNRFMQPFSTSMYSIKWETYLFTLKRVMETI